jgi:Mn2+/Fe2+ NRAMP family transporter
LIGTTVIPYDLFLGSGALNKKQSIKDMRFGLSFAVILGGIISMSVMGVGNAVTEGMSEAEKSDFLNNLNFDSEGYVLLTNHLRQSIGVFAVYIFGIGMFAAGFSSAVTSPLASAITARSLFSNEKNEKRWHPKKLYFKLVIAGVLAVGLTFGYMGVKPIPAIIIAQAFNGLILPLIAVFLIDVVNDPEIIGETHLNGWFSNILMGLVLWITMILGFTNISNAVARSIGYSLESTDKTMMMVVVILSFLISVIVLWRVYRKRVKLVEQRL